MQAYIYARFSTLEQSKGSSLSRQLDDCRALCDRNRWQRSADRERVDEGRSAFDGTNRAEGSALAALEHEALEGLLPSNAVLVVERLDRLSRQSAVDVFQFITKLTDAGVAVATVDGDRLYRKGTFTFASLIELIIKAQVSHEESEKKSQRVAAAWARKRAQAQAGNRRALSRRCPAWIGVDECSGEYVLLEGRAAVIRRIFDLTTSGLGKHRIARMLNVEGVPVLGNAAQGWHASYIQKIVQSRAAVGELQLYRKVGGKRIAEGEPLRGHYPAVIDEGTFARAQADRAGRAAMPGRRGKRISNLLAGLARCGSCGGAMAFRNKGSPGEQYLVCDGALRGRGCEFTTHFNYPTLETAIIDQTLHLALDDRHFSAPVEVVALEAEQAEQLRLLNELESRQRRLVDLLSRVDSDEIERQLGEVVVEVTATKARLPVLRGSLTRARGAVSPQENVSRIRGVVSALRGGGDLENIAARATVQQALRSLVRSVTCDPRSQRVAVALEAASFILDRRGALIHGEAPAELGLSALLSLRERGWVLAKYQGHPALGAAKSPLPDGSY